MGNFNRGGKPGGSRGGFEKRGFGGGRDRGFGGGGGRPQLFDATCSTCGQAFQLPFRPSGDRPVFCNSCFKTQGNDSGRRPSGGGFGKPSFRRDDAPRSSGGGQDMEQLKSQIAQLNNKLDKILSVLSPVVKEAVKAPVVVEKTKKAKTSLAKTKAEPKKPAKKKK